MKLVRWERRADHAQAAQTVLQNLFFLLSECMKEKKKRPELYKRATVHSGARPRAVDSIFHKSVRFWCIKEPQSCSEREGSSRTVHSEKPLCVSSLFHGDLIDLMFSCGSGQRGRGWGEHSFSWLFPVWPAGTLTNL